MRRARQDLIRVGLFVLLAGTLLVGGLMWIAGARVFRPVDTYTVLFDRSVTGLNAGANVEYKGVVVGRVRDMRLTSDIPPKVAVICDLEPGTPIRQDTYAALLGSLVTGIKYIELQGGTAAAEPLARGGTMRGDAQSLEEFRDRVTEIADRVADILRDFQTDFFTKDNSAKLQTILADFANMTSTLSRTVTAFRAEQTGKDLADLIGRLSEAATNANAVLADFYARRETIYGHLDSTLRNLDATVQQTQELVRSTQGEVSGTGTSVAALVHQLTVTTQRLQETIDVIRSDPSIVLWGREVPEREFER